MKGSSSSDEGRQCGTSHNEYNGSCGYTYSKVATLSLLTKKKTWIQIRTAQRRYDEHDRGVYKSVGRGVGRSCSFGAYLAKKGKKRVSMTPTMANM